METVYCDFGTTSEREIAPPNVNHQRFETKIKSAGTATTKLYSYNENTSYIYVWF